ncbi:MAG: hypothetical protein AAF519_13335 [Bacteroidota bacterium]
MIHIYTDLPQNKLMQALSRTEGLLQATQIKPLVALDTNNPHIIINDDKIIVPIPWDGTEPPVLFDAVPYNENDLIAILLCKLGYESEALEFVKSVSIKNSLHCRQQLRDLDQSLNYSTVQDNGFISTHNYAALTHYAGHLYNGASTEKLYEKAIAESPNGEHSAFIAKHLAVFLTDNGEISKAEKLLRYHQKEALSDEANNYLNLDLVDVLMASSSIPYDQERLSEVKQLISTSLPFFEQHDIHWAVATLYMNASEIANFEQSYSESLSYITKAITIYEEHGFPEFLASAYIRKGTLLYTWAQHQNPQFYQSAIDTYQKALETFTRELFPDVYAEIHHNLAVIYAEMPVDEKKKGMWSAFSATSFKECLDFYQKETYPFEYAMVANNYANALLKYPPAKTGDNAEKAIAYYLEALEIRNEEQFPLERAHTILNYLEACWRVHNINKTMERARYKDMVAKAKEVKKLTDNHELLSDAQAHLDQISALGLAIMKD